MYNTKKPRLRMPQYGRGVEQMARQLLTIENKEERGRAARRVVGVMATMVGKEGAERYSKSLWDHLAYLCDYQLDIDFPAPVTRIDAEGVRPARLRYPLRDIRLRQYGHLIEQQLRTLSEMPEGPERDELLALTANRMKQSLADWNRDAMDEHRISADIRRYTHDAVALPEGFLFERADFSPLYTMTSGKKKKKRRY